MTFLIMTGDPASGLQFTGPFQTYQQAWAYATRNSFGQFEIVECTTPEDPQ